ncbi:hypothetical protein ASD64_07230 [Mesorhizobium sp. Root157]|uniref:hypothetical protein n=1 Tax=Mesorhizobium sp. Root157 TaxID=1736477 RepID=UPI0006F5B120|nr:hypothetical protein [Mesorhizobium sp. Root157]KQZ87223.1 hypothetical protein ASD64_07230 [Mesorhizobium sp. Root157]
MTLWINNLKRLVALVDEQMAHVSEASGSSDTKTIKDYAAWRKRHDAAMRALMAFFMNQEDASFTSRGSDCSVKMASIRSTCTSGFDGALRNWQTAARKKIDAAQPAEDVINLQGSGPAPIVPREG